MRRRFKKGASGGPKALWSQIPLNNVNWVTNQTATPPAGSLLSGASPGPVFRFWSITPENVLPPGQPSGARSDEENMAFVKRVISKVSMHAVLANLRVNGDAELAENTIRDDIPGPGGIGLDSEGYTGYLLAGGIKDSVLRWSPSAWEGIPVNWWLMYETWEQFNTALDSTFLPQDAVSYQKNRRVFAQGMVAPALTRPVMFSLDKRLPGRGVQLTPGDRDTWAITLAMQVVGGDASVRDRVGFFAGETRVMYYRP